MSLQSTSRLESLREPREKFYGISFPEEINYTMKPVKKSR